VLTSNLKTITKLKLEYSRFLGWMVRGISYWFKQEPYCYVFSELKKLEDQLYRLEKIIYFTPLEEVKELEIPKKFLELALALENSDLPKIYLLIQKLEKIKEEIHYEYKSRREKWRSY